MTDGDQIITAALISLKGSITINQTDIDVMMIKVNKHFYILVNFQLEFNKSRQFYNTKLEI